MRSNGSSREAFPIFLKDGLYNIGFSNVFGGPGRFRKVREADRKKHSNLVQIRLDGAEL